jgi:malonate transporter and related proteins
MSAFSSLLNVFILVATGAALRSLKIIRPEDWRGLERITYFVLFPAMLVMTTATADLASTPFFTVGATLVASLMTVALGLLVIEPVLRRWLSMDGPSFSSVFQGSIRWNSFVAFALASSLYGKQGAALGAVAITAMIPLLNILSVGVIARYASAKRPTPAAFLLTLIKNPFIWSCVIGLVSRPVIGFIPGAVLTPLGMIGQISLVTGLLAVGGGLDLSTLTRPGIAHFLSGTLKLVAMPCIALGFASVFGVTGIPLSVTIISMAVPTASASYILARQLGGNATLMAEILTLQTLAGMVSMPVLLASIGPS